MVSVVKTTYDVKLEDPIIEQSCGRTDLVVHMFNDVTYETVLQFFSFNAKQFIAEVTSDDKKKLLTGLMEEGVSNEDANLILTNLVLIVDDIMFSDDYVSTKNIKLCATIQVHNLNNLFDEEGASSHSMITDALIDPQPASEESINNLERSMFVSTIKQDAEDISCPICLEMYDEFRSLLKMPCGHKFDETCLLTWFESRHDCPICRFSLSF